MTWTWGKETTYRRTPNGIVEIRWYTVKGTFIERDGAKKTIRVRSPSAGALRRVVETRIEEIMK